MISASFRLQVSNCCRQDGATKILALVFVVDIVIKCCSGMETLCIHG